MQDCSIRSTLLSGLLRDPDPLDTANATINLARAQASAIVYVNKQNLLSPSWDWGDREKSQYIYIDILIRLSPLHDPPEHLKTLETNIFEAPLSVPRALDTY